MPDQAESLRRLVLQAAAQTDTRRAGSLVLVFDTPATRASTRLSTQLALAWQRRQQTGALVEIRRHAPSSVGRSPWLPRTTLREVLCRDRTLREAWQTGPCGLAIVHGDLADEPLPNEHALVTQLQQAAIHQRVVVDVQAIADLHSLLPAADHCVFVSAAETDALLGMYRAIKATVQRVAQARCWLALKQGFEPSLVAELQSRIVTTCDRCLNLALDPLGHVPWEQTSGNHAASDAKSSSDVSAQAVSDRQAFEQMCARIEAADQANPRRHLMCDVG